MSRLCRFQGLTAQVNEEANGLLSRVATFLQKEQLPSALRSRLAAAQEVPQRQQRGQQQWSDEQGQVPPLQSNKGISPDLHFEFSSTCSQELLVIRFAVSLLLCGTSKFIQDNGEDNDVAVLATAVCTCQARVGDPDYLHHCVLLLLCCSPFSHWEARRG